MPFFYAACLRRTTALLSGTRTSPAYLRAAVTPRPIRL